MKKAMFDELVESLREAGSIHRGEAPPSRRFVFEPEDIRAIREKLEKSQSEFAQMIGVTVSTLQNWEQGRRQPQGPARALLVVAARAPQLVADAPAAAAQRRERKPRAAKRVPVRGGAAAAKTAHR
jgi:putative transcriptional regulator